MRLFIKYSWIGRKINKKYVHYYILLKVGFFWPFIAQNHFKCFVKTDTKCFYKALRKENFRIEHFFTAETF